MNKRIVAARLLRMAKVLLSEEGEEKTLFKVASSVRRRAGLGKFDWSSRDDLPESEKKIADKMKEKGYNFVVQITTSEGDFGEPLYFRDSGEIGPFLRSFPAYKNAKLKWSVKLSSASSHMAGIPGGLSEGMDPSEFNQEELKMGIGVEMEHLVKKGRPKKPGMEEMAKEIAMDHLVEIPDYYTRLKKMEKEAETASSKRARLTRRCE